jgi:hypothetical protein
MTIRPPVLRWSVALVAALLSGVAFVFLFGLLAPMLIQEAVYGREAVYSAPAHGGAILILTAPAAALLALFGSAFLATYLASRVWAPPNNSYMDSSRK